MMEMMSQPKYARLGKSFVSEDRKTAMFMLRMIEAHRTKYRVDVVNDLRTVCGKYGFTVYLVGGIYYLQGRLAKLVAESLVTGLFWLNLLFVVIAWIVARSVRGALAMIASLMLVPLSMLGGIGWFHVPLDVISAPATNVCIGIAIDSMIHLVFGVRRAQRDGKGLGRLGRRTRGAMARDRLFRPNLCRWVCDLCALGFSAHATLRLSHSVRLDHRYPGKPVCPPPARRRGFKKARLRMRYDAIL